MARTRQTARKSTGGYCKQSRIAALKEAEMEAQKQKEGIIIVQTEIIAKVVNISKRWGVKGLTCENVGGDGRNNRETKSHGNYRN